LVQGDVERLETTIEELLALARDTAAERAAVDLGAVLDELGRRWHTRFAGAGRRLTVDLADDVSAPTVPELRSHTSSTCSRTTHCVMASATSASVPARWPAQEGSPLQTKDTGSPSRPPYSNAAARRPAGQGLAWRLLAG
jgi:hypothetical protein